MKRLIAAVAIAVLATSCTAQPTGPERAFLHDVHTYTPELTELYDDGELLIIAWSVCEAFAAGATQDQVLDGFADYPHDVELAALAGAAVAVLCPDEAP